MTTIEVKLEWYLEALTGSVAMQVSVKSYQLLEQIDDWTVNKNLNYYSITITIGCNIERK